MMETKVWFALCALLLITMGPAEQCAAASPSEAPVTGATHNVSASSMDSTSHSVHAQNGSDAKNSSNDTTVSPSLAPHNNSTAQSPVPSLRNISTTLQTLPATGHPHMAENTSKDTTNTTISKPTNPETNSSTSAPTPQQPSPNSNVTAATNSTQSSLHPTISSSPELTMSNNETQTLTSPHTSPHTSAPAQPQVTMSPSAQAKAHIDSPTQLNVGGNTTMVRESPSSKPLLAGLVSAFIITTVIISLLLFIKLRRRNNRPQFRRLQDLPMEDMEDTPLSMYTY